MDNDKATRESSTPAQCSKDADEPNGNASSTADGPVACDLISANNLSGQTTATPEEAFHQHCNESSCDVVFKTLDNANGSSCQFSAHHYHYIEYPGVCYEKKYPQNASMAVPESASSNSYHYCMCSCSSGGRQLLQQQPQQQQEDSRLAVAAIVHHQSIEADCSLRAKSQQSLLSHSYQMLNIPAEKKATSICRSKLNINCDIEGNCTSATCSCTASPEQPATQTPIKRSKKQSDTLAESVLATADEITVSESDNNGSLTKRKNMRESRVQKKINSWYAKNYNCNHIETYSDGEEGDNNIRNDTTASHGGSLINILDQRPPLPPRPQPIVAAQNTNNTFNGHRPGSQSVKKYVIWCLVCGGFSCLLGALFLGVYFLLHSYTITVGNFETVPTFVPATLLILTGLCIMSLARRRNRYSYLIKLSGACGLISALTCALVTVTTTVLHMSRLQALRECEYAQKTRTCTCYSDMIESQVDRVDKEGVRLVFDSLSDCGVVHGSLYSCLRAIFGLSVAGVLVAVFSCMLVYQLLSHERKKMYWEQLELRCRSLYTSHQQQHQQQIPSAHGMATLAGIGARSAPICRCCEQCHAHRQMQLQTASYPWVDDSGEPRFWAGQPPGNFYSPNPGGEEHNLHASAGANNRSRASSGWSWPRMPWQRSSTESGNRFRQIPSSPDSQYGFSSTNPSLGMAVSNAAVATTTEDDATAAAVAAVAAATATQRAAQAYNIVAGGGALPYGIWGPPPPYSDPNSPARRGYYQYMQPANSICIANRAGEGSGVGNNDDVLQQRPLSASALNAMAAGSAPNVGTCVAQRNFDHLSQRLCATDQLQSNIYKSKDNTVGASLNKDYGNTASDSDAESALTRFGDRFSNTLPTRKIKKRVVDGSSSITKCVGSGSRHQLFSHRVNVQRVFPNSSNSTSENDADANSNMRPLNSIRYGKSCTGNSKDNRPSAYATESNSTNRVLQNMHISEHVAQHCNNELDGNACLNNCDGNGANHGAAISIVPANCDAPYEDPTESEIYFADVSSCCNMSMKNDNCYEDSSRNKQQQQQLHHQSTANGIHQPVKRTTPKISQQQFHHHHHQHQHSNCSQSSNISSGGCFTPKDDNLVQHFNQREREGSIRSRIPARQVDSCSQKINAMQMKTIAGINGDGTNNFTNAAKMNNKSEISIPKDSSLHSMCSMDSEAKTECTDLSPLSPCSNKSPADVIFQCESNNSAVPQTPNTTSFSNFIASFPYSSESKFHEAHRRFTKHMHDNLPTSAATEIQETHYEVINDDGLDNMNKKQMSMRVPKAVNSHQQKPKNLNSNCGYDKSSVNRIAHNRNTKTKDNLNAVWPSSDASGSGHNRQRL